MYRVLIVDDDKLIIDDLTALIDWQEFGCFTPGRAANGQLALNMLLEEPYDIVLTDISMPVMDGVELIRCAKEKGCGAVFLVISNYDDFTYVKEAMKLGAVEYLLKYEITASSLAEQIQFAKTFVGKRPYVQTKAQRETLRQHLFQELYDGNEAWREMLAEAGVPKGQGTIAPVLMPAYGNKALDGFAKVTETIKGLGAEADGMEVFCKAVEEYRLLLLLFVKNPSYLFVTNQVTSFLKKIFEAARQEDLLLGAYVLRFCHTWSEVGEALAAGRKQGQTFFYLKPFSITYGIKRKSGAPYQLEEAAWETELHRGEPGQGCGQLFRYLEEHCVPAEEAKGFCVKLLAHGNLPDRTAAEIWNARNAYDIRMQMERLLKSQKEIGFWETERVEIRCVLQYLSENYEKRITLEELSSFAGLSPTYLCRLFKAEMGMSYSEYLNKVRIERAKVLLASSSLRTNEISSQVGFLDYRYFCRVFKRLTGVTCGEFRRKRIKGS